MRSKNMILTAAVLLLTALAAASMMIPADDNAKEHAKAPEKSPAIGENWDLERVDFIHYARPTNPAKPAKAAACYKLMGVKWSTLPVDYTINPSNPQGLSESFVTSAVSDGAEAWDDATSQELFNTYTIDGSAQYGQDYKNSIVFGRLSDDNAIAVTSIWYTRVGKRIVESDMVFNTYYTWGDAAEDNTAMDLQNIATHEFGHTVGLSDLYTTSCSYVTMYGYSDYGDIAKRSLEQPDVNGLQALYGA